MQMKAPVENGDYRCDFCGKARNEVRVLVAGPNHFICNECVAECSAVVLELSKGTMQ